MSLLFYWMTNDHYARYSNCDYPHRCCHTFLPRTTSKYPLASLGRLLAHVLGLTRRHTNTESLAWVYLRRPWCSLNFPLVCRYDHTLFKPFAHHCMDCTAPFWTRIWTAIHCLVVKCTSSQKKIGDLVDSRDTSPSGRHRVPLYVCTDLPLPTRC